MVDESKIPEIQEIVSAYPFTRGTTLSHKSLNQICEGLSNVTDSIDTKQDVISDLGTIRSNAQKATTAVQPDALSNYYTKDEIDGELATKQDTITDLGTIRSGATLGATAIQPEVLQQQLSNYLTETEVNELIANINSFEVEIVNVLPESGNTHTIYFVPASDGVESDFYNEYMYINGKMELIGNTRIDLTDYYTKDEIDAELNKKQNTLVAGTNIEISGDTISSKVYEASEFDIKDLADSEGLRTKWDNKQDAITDLEAIRTGAALGATAIQESGLQAALNGYYTSGKTDELLATKQDVINNLTEIEQNAASGKTAFDSLITKQDVIEDLGTIRSGAALGATAIQESGLNEALSAYLTSAQTMELIGEIDHFAVKVVDTLPVSGEPNTIYFVSAEGGDPTDAKNEYIYVEGIGWELIGTTRIDLTDYYTSGKTDELLATKQDVINDLGTIRSGAALGATAVQESDLQTALSGYYTSGVTDELLDAKQDVLTAGSHIEISGDTISVVGLSDVLYTSITHSELVSLRDNSGLTPGMKYRITDYTTTVNPSLSDVQSAGHVFDIIVEATDVDKLSENAKAIQSVRDVDGYFAEVNLDAWELKYCLDNDTTKFDWADDSTNGKGVIYWLKDEHNNECPYDFKNIQFKRYLVTSSLSTASTEECVFYGKYVGQIIDSEMLPKGLPEGYEVSSSDNKFLYTFTIISGNSVLDNTLGLDLSSYDVGYIHLCLQNDIEPNLNQQSFSMDLNNIVFVSEMSSVNDIMNCITIDNKFNTMCYGNTFMGMTMGNTFGNGCRNNTFGNYCDSNTFGNGCRNNTFGNYCDSNTFGNYCDSNTFGNYCDSNTFGNDCQHNTFGNGYIKDCRFGDGVDYCAISGYENLDGYGTDYYIRNIVVLNGTKGNYEQLLELNQNEMFNTHNFKPDDDLAPQIVCGFFVNENNIMTYIAKYYFAATLG